MVQLVEAHGLEPWCWEFESLLYDWSFGTASSGLSGSGDQHDVMELVDMQARDACAPPKACGFDSHHRDLASPTGLWSNLGKGAWLRTRRFCGFESHQAHAVHGSARHSTVVRKLIVPSVISEVTLNHGTKGNGNPVSIADEAEAWLATQSDLVSA